MLGIQPDFDVDPRQGAAQGKGTGGDAATVPLVQVHAGNMEGLEALLLQLVMFDLRIALGNDVGDGIGAIGQAIQARVMLHDADLAAGLRHHEVARMGCQLASRGEEQQVDWLLGDGARRHADIGAISHERHIQGGETGCKTGRVLACATHEQRFQAVWCALQRGGQAGQLHARRQGADARPLRLVRAIDEYHQVRASQGERLDLRCHRAVQAVAGLRQCHGKAASLECGHAGVFPVLLAQRGEPGLGEILQRLPARVRKPAQAAAGQCGLDASELGEIVLQSACAHVEDSIPA